MTFHSAALRFTFVFAVGLSTVGCQHTAVADDPQVYGPGAAQPTGLNAYCSTMARDAVVWGTLPSAWCAPYGPSWYGPPYPYSYYGRPYGWTGRGPSWGHYRGYSGRGFGGGWRGGRGGRR